MIIAKVARSQPMIGLGRLRRMNRGGVRQRLGHARRITPLRWVGAVVLLVVGGHALYRGLSDDAGWRIAQGALLLVFGLAGLVDVVRQARKAATRPDA